MINRLLFLFAGAIFNCCFLISELYSQGILIPLLTNGATSKEINIVVFSEGYTINQKSKFISDANNAINTFLNTQPYSEYKSYFNAYAVFIASNESGSDHPSAKIYHDTYFNSTYESYGIDRLVTIPPNDKDSDYDHGAGKIYKLLQSLMPEYDIVLLLVNDTQYGGSGGSIAISSISPLGFEVAIHEIGHSFASLGDEYSTATPGYSGSERVNTTAEKRREYIKWNKWISPVIPVPTQAIDRYFQTVGLFEGACYMANDWYRPKYNCKMRSNNIPFCEVCTEQIIKTIYNRVRPIESFWPENRNILMDNGITLNIISRQPNHNLIIQWYINDSAINGATALTLDITRELALGGPITVKVKVIDDINLVRNDPNSLLRDSVIWNISANQTVQLSAPALSYPTNNMLKVNPGTLFTWNEANLATSYNLQVSTNATDWSTPVIDVKNITGTSYAPFNPLKDETRYYWRVNSTRGNLLSDWSLIRNFITASLKPDIPKLSSPLNNIKNQPVKVNLAWEKSEGAETFHLQVSTTDLFDNFVYNDTAITGLSKEISNLKYNTDYYWRARSKNRYGSSQWSDIYLFTTINIRPDAPKLSAPNNNSVDISKIPILKWLSAENTNSYRLQVSSYSNFTSFVIDTSGLTLTSFSLNGLQSKKNYYWRVCGRNTAGISEWSNIWIFKTLNTPPKNIALLKPSSDEVIIISTPKKPVKFVWNRSYDDDEEDTLRYAITIAGPGYNFTKEKISDTSVLLDIMQDLKLQNNYSWKVSVTDGASNTVSNPLNFSITQTASAPKPEKEIIRSFELNQNYPNPFNPSTSITFQLPSDCYVTLKVFDIIGKEIATIIDRRMESGIHSITYEPGNIPGGIYFYKLFAGGYIGTRKMVYLR